MDPSLAAVVIEQQDVRHIRVGAVAARKLRRGAEEQVTEEADCVGDVETAVLIAVSRHLQAAGRERAHVGRHRPELRGVRRAAVHHSIADRIAASLASVDVEDAGDGRLACVADGLRYGRLARQPQDLGGAGRAQGHRLAEREHDRADGPFVVGTRGQLRESESLVEELVDDGAVRRRGDDRAVLAAEADRPAEHAVLGRDAVASQRRRHIVAYRSARLAFDAGRSVEIEREGGVGRQARHRDDDEHRGEEHPARTRSVCGGNSHGCQPHGHGLSLLRQSS